MAMNDASPRATGRAAPMARAAAVAIALASLGLLGVDIALFEFFGPLIVVPIAVLPLALVGALLIARIPRNPVGWLLGLSGVLFALTFASGAYSWSALVGHPGTLPAGEFVAAISNGLFPPALGSAVLLLLYFPSGHGLGGRWTWLERGLLTLLFLITVTGTFKDAPIEIAAPLPLGLPSGHHIQNPLAPHGLVGAVIDALAPVGDSAGVPVVLLGPLSLFVRYRRSPATEREQIKWLAYSGSIALGLFVAANFVPADSGNWLWGGGVVALGLFPIAIAVAILRYRLYDIDVLIRRTLIYAGVSGVLAAIYLGAVAVSQAVLASFTGGSSVAVAVSTLAVVALFQPVRTRIRSAIDRRFYRATYDAERTLDTFAARLRDEVDLAALERELLAVVDATVQPARAGVWLRP